MLCALGQIRHAACTGRTVGQRHHGAGVQVTVRRDVLLANIELKVGGVIGATSQQYPLLMASLGIEAIAAWAADGTKPQPSEGLDFFNTGVSLVTGTAADGVESIGIAEGKERCWG